MQKLSIDFASDLAGAPRVVGSIDWISSQAIPVKRVAPIKKTKAIKEDWIVIDTQGRHGLAIGEQIYLENVGTALNGFHLVAEHPVESVDSRNCFAIKGFLGEAFVPEKGRVRWLEEHAVTNPDFLSLEATTALGGLDQEMQMLALEVVAPEAYAKLMSIMQSSAEGGNKALEESKAELAEAAEAMQSGLFNGKPLDPSVLTSLKALQNLRPCREIEIICGMPKGLISEAQGMRDIDKRITAIYSYITEAAAGNDQKPEREKPSKSSKTSQKKTASKESSDSGSPTADTAKQS